MPFRFLTAVGVALGSTVPLLAPQASAGLERNLRIACPQATEKDLVRLVRDAFGSYGRYWVESFRIPWLKADFLDEGFEVEGHEHLLEARRSGLGPIMAIPHLGGWEWAAAWLGRVADTPVTAVVEQLEPEDVFDWFRRLRESYGAQIVPLGPDAMGPLLSAIKKNHVLCLLSDRDISDTGIEVQFFGRPTTLPVGPALLARRTGTVILPTAVYFQGPKRLCRIEPPISVDRSLPLRQSLTKATQEVADALERLIAAAPEQWHVLQPIWMEEA